MAIEAQDSNARAIIEAAEKYGECDVIAVNGVDGDPVELLSMPTGRSVISVKKFLDEYRFTPERRVGTARLTTLESFIAHIVRHRSEHTAVFADVENRSAPKLVAVLDYQPAGPSDTGWGQHRAEYAFPVSPEWSAWTVKTADYLTQRAFAEFLEDRVGDVIDPREAGELTKQFAQELGLVLASPQRLLELSRGLSMRVDQKVVQHVNLSTGEAQIGFEERHGEDGSGAPLKVPGGCVIAVPVFRSGASYQVPVRLRYRVSGGSVSWLLSPQRIDKVWDHAVSEAVEAVRAGTERPVFYGTPER